MKKKSFHSRNDENQEPRADAFWEMKMIARVRVACHNLRIACARANMHASLGKLRFIFSPRNPSSTRYGDYIYWMYNNLPELEKPKILDVGSGPGIFTRIAKTTFKPKLMVAVDIDPSVLTSLRDEIEVVLADGENLPFRDSVFDLVLSISLLEHLKNPERSIREHFRVSRSFVSFQIPNLRYWIEIHTMVPLLGFMPSRIRRALSGDLNYSVTLKMLLTELISEGRVFIIRKYYLPTIMKLLGPIGFQVIAKKESRALRSYHSRIDGSHEL